MIFLTHFSLFEAFVIYHSNRRLPFQSLTRSMIDLQIVIHIELFPYFTLKVININLLLIVDLFANSKRLRVKILINSIGSLSRVN